LRGGRFIRIGFRGAVVLLLIVGVGPPALGATVEDSTVKAAILFNVARFTEWPTTSFGSDAAPMVLCVVGADPDGAMERLDGKTLKGRSLRVRAAADGGLRACHIAYVGPDHPDLREVVKAAEQFGVLTVSDADRFARKGGMIGLVNEGGKIRFEINLKAAQQAGIKLSSQLLKLASIVRN
jgi:hypothetical protein